MSGAWIVSVEALCKNIETASSAGVGLTHTHAHTHLNFFYVQIYNGKIPHLGSNKEHWEKAEKESKGDERESQKIGVTSVPALERLTSGEKFSKRAIMEFG